jgi:DnaJ-class molecular chaperone
VDIQKGMQHGDTIKFDQVADEAVGHTAGDLVFIVQQAKDERFTRQGDNLHMDFQVTLLESLVGFRRVIEHLDGHQVVIENNDVTYCSQVIAIANEGMPIKGTNARGILFVTLHVDFPAKFNAQQKELFKKALSV